MSERLTREQRNALKVLVENLPNMQTYIPNSDQLQKYGPLLKTNFMAASMTPINKTTLPRQQHWSWNQSNAKVIFDISENTTVTFRKMSTKSNVNSTNTPSCKLWMFEVQSKWQEPIFFLWCEKGADEEPIGIDTEIGRIYPERISTESLSFLKPFVEEGVAEQLGWEDA